MRQLGIERVQALVQDAPWTLTGDLLARVGANTESGGTVWLLYFEHYESA